MAEKLDKIDKVPKAVPERASGTDQRGALIDEIGHNRSQVLQTLGNNLRDASTKTLKAFGNLELISLADVSKTGFSLNNSETNITYNKKSKLPEQMRFADGTKRTFKRDNSAAPEEITTVEIKPPNETAFKWVKVPGTEQYTNGQQSWKAKFETKGDKYIVTDLETGNISTRTTDGTTIELDAKTRIEKTTLKGLLTKIKKDDSEIIAERDNKGEISAVSDTKRNCRWQRQSDKSWHVAALDESKPFKAPANFISGKAELSSNGDYTFTDKDRAGERFRLDGSQDRLIAMFNLRDKVEKSAVLNSEQKERMLSDYLPKVESRQFIGKDAEESDKERAEAISQLSSLLDKPQPGGYTEQECGKMLEQLAFHFAYPTIFQQASGTCNVTALGICFLHESPSQLAKVMAEVGITGSFRTADGSTITPPKLDIQAALRDQTFPPHPTDPAATGLSRAFIITAANIAWQRRTVDDSGNPVAKGSLYYAQEGGEGIFYNQNGQRYYSNDRDGRPITNNPLIRTDEVIDIAEQITGAPFSNRVLVHKNPAVDFAPTWEGTAEANKRVVTVSNIEEFHNALTADRAQIVYVHTSKPPFHYDSGDGNEPGAGGPTGNWHVVVKTKYYPVYDAYLRLDLNLSTVCIDNSWNPTRADRLTRERGIPLAQFYNATH